MSNLVGFIMLGSGTIRYILYESILSKITFIKTTWYKRIKVVGWSPKRLFITKILICVYNLLMKRWLVSLKVFSLYLLSRETYFFSKFWRTFPPKMLLITEFTPGILLCLKLKLLNPNLGGGGGGGDNFIFPPVGFPLIIQKR